MTNAVWRESKVAMSFPLQNDYYCVVSITQSMQKHFQLNVHATRYSASQLICTKAFILNIHIPVWRKTVGWFFCCSSWKIHDSRGQGFYLTTVLELYRLGKRCLCTDRVQLCFWQEKSITTTVAAHTLLCLQGTASLALEFSSPPLLFFNTWTSVK